MFKFLQTITFFLFFYTYVPGWPQKPVGFKKWHEYENPYMLVTKNRASISVWNLFLTIPKFLYHYFLDYEWWSRNVLINENACNNIDLIWPGICVYMYCSCRYIQCDFFNCASNQVYPLISPRFTPGFCFIVCISSFLWFHFSFQIFFVTSIYIYVTYFHLPTFLNVLFLSAGK